MSRNAGQSLILMCNCDGAQIFNFRSTKAEYLINLQCFLKIGQKESFLMIFFTKKKLPIQLFEVCFNLATILFSPEPFLPCPNFPQIGIRSIYSCCRLWLDALFYFDPKQSYKQSPVHPKESFGIVLPIGYPLVEYLLISPCYIPTMANKDQSLSDWYANIIAKLKTQLQELSPYLVVNAWFAKRTFVDKII